MSNRQVVAHKKQRRSDRGRAAASTVRSAGIGHNKPPPDPPEPPLTHAELNRFLTLRQAAEQLGVHEDTARAHLAKYIEHVSARRVGVRYKHVIANRPAA